MKPNSLPTLQQVERFWDNHPLFSDESVHEPGSAEYFEDHRQTYFSDVFSGRFPRRRFVPRLRPGSSILDVGCGAGFWTVELARHNPDSRVSAVDLTDSAVKLTERRLALLDLVGSVSKGNAENLPFDSGSFDHVNCQGVIHHTPDQRRAVGELFRVAKPGGTVFISVYYRNAILSAWPHLSALGSLLARMGGRMVGRGREGIFLERDAEEIVRLYDGSENPLGLAYSRSEVFELLPSTARIDQVFLNFFPARSLPFPLPASIHHFLSRVVGFMIHVNCQVVCADEDH